jgi:hypothetical protein
MLADTNLVDPWIRAISLFFLPEHPEVANRESVQIAACKYYSESNVSECRPFVRIIERQTAQTVTLDWRDSTNCCYREQLWVAARSRVSARCALSGAPISPGDEIFRPRPTRPAPRNVGAMILASAVDASCRRGAAFEYVLQAQPVQAPRAEECVAVSDRKAVLSTHA